MTIKMQALRSNFVRSCAAAVCLLAFSQLTAAETRKEFRYTVGNGATISVANMSGNITVRPGAGRQVSITAALNSDKVEINSRQSGNRIENRTHFLSKASGEAARVNYEITAPADISLNIESASGEISIEGINGIISVETESATVSVKNGGGGFVQLQSVNGNLLLSDLKQTRVQAVSTGGAIELTNVTGPKVSARSTSGAIRMRGDCAGGGNYSLANHSGDIELMLPANASIELQARSVKGSVENDFPFQKNSNPPFPVSEGRAFAGTSNNGSSSVELRSFSGKIRVKKQ